MFNKIYKTGKLKIWNAYRDEVIEKHQLTYLFWECTLGCNFFCKHCGSNANAKKLKDELMTDEIVRTFAGIAEDYDARKIGISVTGGEPLLRRDIFEVMGKAREMGFNWGMVTNAFFITPEIVEKMIKTGMSSVSISVDGIGKDHDSFRRMTGAYDRVVKAVRLMAEANFLKFLQITTSVHPGNLHKLEDMYLVFKDLGIKSWRIVNVDPIGRAEDNKDILLDGQQFKQMLEFIKRKRKESPIDITYGCSGFLGAEFEGDVRENFFFCRTGVNIASILSNGDVFVCPNVPRRKEFIRGNVRQKRFSEIWEKDFDLFRKLDRTCNESCRGCEFWDNCRGGPFHLWDFNRNIPKICHTRMLGEK